jgi:hypothetical protein
VRTSGISREGAREYLRRHALVQARISEERAEKTWEQKLDELEQLMSSIDDFGWREALDDDAPVRARWARLRQVLG